MAPLASFALLVEAPDSDTCVISVEGEADMGAAVKFNESFFTAAQTGAQRVVADLTGVSFIDSTMLNALVVSHRRLARSEGRFAVVCNGPRVARVFEMTGLEQMLDVFETREAALAHVREAG
jgi:anti-anti-sigma factor